MPTVRGPIAARTAAGSMVMDPSEMSTNRIAPPACVMASVVAMKVCEAVITSSPGRMPSAM